MYVGRNTRSLRFCAQVLHRLLLTSNWRYTICLNAAHLTVDGITVRICVNKIGTAAVLESTDSFYNSLGELSTAGHYRAASRLNLSTPRRDHLVVRAASIGLRAALCEAKRIDP
ncbi:hypothetical protein WT76_30020 [Burkholderia stagnalis]|nr:hypothetical protein WT76_30020 [Burkholderia stagnalis]